MKPARCPLDRGDFVTALDRPDLPQMTVVRVHLPHDPDSWVMCQWGSAGLQRRDNFRASLLRKVR